MRGFLALVLTTVLAIGCATTSPASEEAAEGPPGDPALEGGLPGEEEFSDEFEEAFGEEALAEGDLAAERPEKARTYRLGFWVIDLAAVDVEPRGTTFRLLDFRIFKLFEAGSGEDYHTFSFVEAPNLFNVLTTRHDAVTAEHRVVDLQAIELALARATRESLNESETHFLKIPVLGSAYGRSVDPTRERQMYFWLIRREVDREETY